MTEFLVSIARLSLWLVLLAAVFVPLERMFGLRPQEIFRKSFAADLGLYFLNSLLPGLVLGVPLALVAIAAHEVVPALVQAAIADAPLWLRMIAGLIVAEVGFYWGHRWSHEIPILWRFHATHHAAEEMDWLVNTRAHPVDMVFTRICSLVPLYALGLGGPPGGVVLAGAQGGVVLANAHGSLVPALVLVAGTAWGFFVHANVGWRFGPLERLVATPAFHHWHHTREGPINRNYAAMLPCLDAVFGTLHLPRRQWPGAYGIVAGPAPAPNFHAKPAGQP